LTGATIHLAGPRGPTVTGTANVLSAAVLARGETTIIGAAVEPEIVDLGRLLVAMGAKIEGLGTPTLHVAGVERLSGATHRVIPDRIEAATLLLAAAITRDSITVTGVVPGHLAEVLAKLATAGAALEIGPDWVKIAAGGAVRFVDIAAEPYPGVPTDIQAQWMAVLSLADGRSTVRDRVFPGRFMHVAELNRLGARIEHADGTAVVTGVPRLTGATVTATDLRATAALVLAGLAAEGETVVRHLEHLDRGYQRLDEKLNRLGAQTERCDD
jgi:UDP-N-acetylglucosamine 1-carboxyvinyltransferase